MSTTPPPPFGSAQGPVPPVGAYDRRTLRAQRQAAAAQARWQRDQIRMQMRAARRTSIVGPILLVAVGIILLLLQTGRLHWPDALAWLARWWPAVLIFAGLLMLGEWALDKQQMAKNGTAVGPRRTLGGGTITLLIFLALLGACVMAAENGSHWARRNLGQSFGESGFGDWRQVMGVRSEFTNTLDAPMPGAGTLTIDDPHGDVTVTGSSQDGKVHVTVQQHIYTWHQNETEGRRRSEEARLSGDGSHLTLVAPTQGQDDADLTVELPHDASVTVHSGHGDVSLEEVRGSAEVEADNGDVKLTALTGPVHVRTKDDNATVSAHSLDSGLTLDGHSGDISLSDIQGPVVLRGDFFGSTHLERVRGSVNFQSSFTNFACAGVPGELTIEGRSDLEARHIQGPLTIATTDRNLNLNGVRGGATVTDRNGSVQLTLAGPPQPVHITNANGSVDLGIPPNQGFGLQARTQNGDIQNDFGLNPEKDADTSELRGKILSGGPLLDLETSQGDISLHRASAEDTQQWADSGTSAPAKPLSHLHTTHSPAQHGNP